MWAMLTQAKLWPNQSFSGQDKGWEALQLQNRYVLNGFIQYIRFLFGYIQYMYFCFVEFFEFLS